MFHLRENSGESISAARKELRTNCWKLKSHDVVASCLVSPMLSPRNFGVATATPHARSYTVVLRTDEFPLYIYHHAHSVTELEGPQPFKLAVRMTEYATSS